MSKNPNAAFFADVDSNDNLEDELSGLTESDEELKSITSLASFGADKKMSVLKHSKTL